jgi:hypothetical protein
MNKDNRQLELNEILETVHTLQDLLTYETDIKRNLDCDILDSLRQLNHEILTQLKELKG